MGRYIDDILQPGEKVLYSTNAHWIFYLPAIAAWIVAAVLLVLSRATITEGIVLLCLSGSGVVALAALYWTFTAWFHRWTTETDVTNLRVVHKTGFIKRRTFEMSTRQGRERRRQPEHPRTHPELWRRHHFGRRRGQGNHQNDCLAAGVSQFHHRAVGAARQP